MATSSFFTKGYLANLIDLYVYPRKGGWDEHWIILNIFPKFTDVFAKSWVAIARDFQNESPALVQAGTLEELRQNIRGFAHDTGEFYPQDMFIDQNGEPWVITLNRLQKYQAGFDGGAVGATGAYGGAVVYGGLSTGSNYLDVVNVKSGINKFVSEENLSEPGVPSWLHGFTKKEATGWQYKQYLDPKPVPVVPPPVIPPPPPQPQPPVPTPPAPAAGGGGASEEDNTMLYALGAGLALFGFSLWRKRGQ